jgi:hypothetical protein
MLIMRLALTEACPRHSCACSWWLLCRRRLLLPPNRCSASSGRFRPIWVEFPETGGRLTSDLGSKVNLDSRTITANSEPAFLPTDSLASPRSLRKQTDYRWPASLRGLALWRRSAHRIGTWVSPVAGALTRSLKTRGRLYPQKVEHDPRKPLRTSLWHRHGVRLDVCWSR